MDVKERLNKIQTRINEAAIRANRESEEIKLIAVSKNQDLEKVEVLQEEGVLDFGESRVQELRDRYDQVPKVNWHMIGHLQRNKVKYLARMDRCKLIHSLDSLRLAKKIDKRARMENRVMDALVQVNIAQDENKYGLIPTELSDYLNQVARFDNLQIKGLMTIVPYVENAEETRPYFKEMKRLTEEIKKEDIPNIKMDELSMGMSNDFEVAIEEGATIIRVGRTLFGSRGY